MQVFQTLRGVIAPLDRANVDTDQIIPKQFLKSIARTGFGEGLFYDWRYLAGGKPNPEFVLNQPSLRGASILVARNNFGCGSSREHAVWAVQQYGFRVVIAPWAASPHASASSENPAIPGFADIFRNNAAKNGLLTVELSPGQVDEIFRRSEDVPGLQATVDLENQKITLHSQPEISYDFAVAAALKQRLLQGLDDIGMTLRQDEAIRTFEEHHDVQMPVSRA